MSPLVPSSTGCVEMNLVLVVVLAATALMGAGLCWVVRAHPPGGQPHPRRDLRLRPIWLS